MYKNIIKYCILFSLILTFDLIFGKTINESQSKTSLDSNEKILVNNASNAGKIASPAASAPKEEVQGKNKTVGVGVGVPVGAPAPASNSNPNETLPKTGDEGNNYNMSGADWNLNNGALLRGFYVFIGLGALVVLYIVVKIIKLKRKRAVRKYGILANNDDVVEMTPLGVDDEDEDMTLFEINSHTRS